MQSLKSPESLLRPSMPFLVALFALDGSQGLAQEGFFKDQYRLPPHTAFICKNSAEQARLRKYVEINYPKYHKINGSVNTWNGQMTPPSPLAVLAAVGAEISRWQRGCFDLCPILKPVKPIGSGWVMAGQYGSGQESDCYDKWIKLVSRSSGRIEVESTNTSRLSERPTRVEFSSTHQIKCNTREYWSKSTWAPINSRTLVDKAAKTFC